MKIKTKIPTEFLLSFDYVSLTKKSYPYGVPKEAKEYHNTHYIAFMQIKFNNSLLEYLNLCCSNMINFFLFKISSSLIVHLKKSN